MFISILLEMSKKSFTNFHKPFIILYAVSFFEKKLYLNDLKIFSRKVFKNKEVKQLISWIILRDYVIYFMIYFFGNKIRRAIVLCSFLFILFSSFVSAATIHGNVYDDSLQKINGALITVNSIPKQTFISQQGTYSFELSKGAYVLNATYKEFSSIQTVQIDTEGDYVIDLILFSVIPEDDLDSSLDLFTFNQTKKENEKQTVFFFGLGLVLFLLVGFLFFFFRRQAKNNAEFAIKTELKDGLKTKLKKGLKKAVIRAAIIVAEERKKEEKEGEEKGESHLDELENLLKIIVKLGSRTTQKDIRKEIPLSEAKISLMLTELESEGKIKKIKKGRGNVIILTPR